MKRSYVIKCGQLYGALNDKRWGWTAEKTQAQVFENREGAERAAALFNDGVKVESL